MLQGLNGFNLRFFHIVFVNGINWILSSKTLFHSCPSNTHCRPVASPIYTIHHIRGLKLLTRLRVGLSHLREHKFHHNFHDTLDPLCSCRSNSIESVENFLLYCPNYSTYRYNLFDNLRQKEILILPYSRSYLVQILLYGNNKFNFASNKEILFCVINFIFNSKRFDGPLY